MPTDPPILDLRPNPTQAEFILSEALENCLVGPRGEGKSDAGIMAMTYHAERQPRSARPVSWIMVRDTMVEHWSQTVKFLRESRWRDHIHLTPDGPQPRAFGMKGKWHCELVGADQPQDLKKLRGVYGGVWIEEAAPVWDYGATSKGISEDHWEMAMSGLRQSGVQPRAQITSNYPEDTHWMWRRFHEDPMPGTALFRIPQGENPHYTPREREILLQRFKNNPAMRARLVEGRPAFVPPGEEVTPEFDERFHVSAHPLEVLRGVPLDLCWDFGLTPVCLFTQIAPGSGQWRIYDAIPGENVGVRQLILGPMMPLLEGKYRGLLFSHIGGVEGLTPEQANSEHSAVREITIQLPGAYRPGPVAWPARRDALRNLHNRRGTFGPAVLLDKVGAAPLILACRGRWHYKRLPGGEVLRDLPVKDHPWSDLGDAYAAGAAVIFGPSGVRVAPTLKSIKSPSYSWSEPTVVIR